MPLEEIFRQKLGSVGIDLLNGCNLKCPHCVIPLDCRKNSRHIITTERLKALIAILVKNGCRSIRLSGGEPMMHPNFKDIYLLIKKAGIDITLFTNGTYLTYKWLNFFRHYPIKRLVITFYGASDQEYEENSFGGTKGMFTRLCKIVKDLPKTDITHVIQCQILKDKPMLAEELFQKLEGTIVRKATMIYPQTVKEESCMLSLDEWMNTVHERGEEFLNNMGKLISTDFLRDALCKDKRLISCGAGYTTIHITADWKVVPCVFYRKKGVKFDEFSFEDIFYNKLPVLLKERVLQESPCYECQMSKYCIRCVALGYGSVGQNLLRERLCQYAKILMEAVT